MAEIKPMVSFGESKKEEKNSDIEVMYEEVLTGLFGRQKKIVVEDKATKKKIEIHRDSLKNLYKPLKLSGFVFKKIIQAHNDVLETGLKTGNERVIALDSETGMLIDDKIGLPNQVKFYIPLAHRGNIITVHNHPNNTPPSPTDLYTFNDMIQIKISVVQGHDGGLYLIEKPRCIKYLIQEHQLMNNFGQFLKNSLYSHYSFNDKLDLFISQTSNQFNWDYRKEQ